MHLAAHLCRRLIQPGGEPGCRSGQAAVAPAGSVPCPRTEATMMSLIRSAAVAFLLVLPLTGCDSRAGGEGGMRQVGGSGPGIDTAGLRALAVPTEFHEGERLFSANCAACHGNAALGTQRGPPLVHIIYEPSHHADFAFQRAVAQGVRAHHWDFGDMPGVPALGQADVDQIVDYVRWLQREAGIG